MCTNVYVQTSSPCVFSCQIRGNEHMLLQALYYKSKTAIKQCITLPSRVITIVPVKQSTQKMYIPISCMYLSAFFCNSSKCEHKKTTNQSSIQVHADCFSRFSPTLLNTNTCVNTCVYVCERERERERAREREQERESERARVCVFMCFRVCMIVRMCVSVCVCLCVCVCVCVCMC